VDVFYDVIGNVVGAKCRQQFTNINILFCVVASKVTDDRRHMEVVMEVECREEQDTLRRYELLELEVKSRFS